MTEQPKLGFRIYLTPRMADRLDLLFNDPRTGKLRYGTLTTLTERAINHYLAAQAAKLEKKDMSELQEGTQEWMTEMARRAAADELDEETLRMLVERLREGRKSLVGQKTKSGGKTTTVTPLNLEDML